MLPLQLTRIFDYRQPAAEQQRGDTLRVEQELTDQNTIASTEIPEERRKQPDRRTTERREKQQATYLNTRKTQGRRHSAGRRLSDAATEYRPISLKG
ncbi:hypothetical protein H8K55_11055 [Undibacterium sp. LX15W]|uniref:Uncharacterized protein n=2 Tax=Undibacterium flavidum TaxID=2762297 RepID=A0ABR6YC52_9BURK|nr:hypothetical protein [Undibacterium flavidum]